MAKMALVSGIQTFKVFAALAAGCNAVTGSAVIGEPGMVHCGAQPCRCLVAHAAIRRCGDVGWNHRVFTLCDNVVVALRAGGQGLVMVDLYRQSLPCRGGGEVAAFTRVGCRRMPGRFSLGANQRDARVMAQRAIADNVQLGMRKGVGGPARCRVAQVTGCCGRYMARGLWCCGND